MAMVIYMYIYITMSVFDIGLGVVSDTYASDVMQCTVVNKWYRYTVQQITYTVKVTLTALRDPYGYEYSMRPSRWNWCDVDTNTADLSSASWFYRRHTAEKYKGRVTRRGVTSSGSHPEFWFTTADPRMLRRGSETQWYWCAADVSACRHAYSGSNSEVTVYGASVRLCHRSNSRPL